MDNNIFKAYHPKMKFNLVTSNKNIWKIINNGFPIISNSGYNSEKLKQIENMLPHVSLR